MKIVFTLIAGLTFVFFSSFRQGTFSTSPNKSYREIASNIEQQLKLHALSSCGSKLTEAFVLTNGEIRINCTKNELVSFNVYQLYKTYETIYGIALTKGNTISFNLSGGKATTLQFPDANIAQQVYESFLALVDAGKDQYAPDLPLDINETVDSINAMLQSLDGFKAEVRVTAKGTIIITNNQMQMFYFNVADLASSGYGSEGLEVNGIEMVPCTYKNVAANNWIKFNTKDGSIAFIKFYEADDEEVGKLHQLFIHLRASLINIMYS